MRDTYFALHYRQNGLHGARLGLVIPKKQARTAVLRNAIKRQARELFRQRRAALPAVDMVLRLVQPIDRHKVALQAKDSRAAWRAEITALFEQLSRKVAP